MKHLLKDAALWREAAFIGGEWVAETPHGRQALHNPADGSLLAELPRCREPETRRAIEAAHAAFGPWKRLTAKERGQVLRRWYELVLQHQDDLATLITPSASSSAWRSCAWAAASNLACTSGR